MHYCILKNTCWRTGVVIASQDGNHAYVKADLTDAKIFIRIDGNLSTRRAFLSVIRNTFDSIHNSISALEVDERIPLPYNSEVSVSYTHLIRLEKRGKNDYSPEGSDRDYNIRELLDSVEDRRSQTKINVTHSGVYRYALPTGSSQNDKELFEKQVEMISQFNPNWNVERDRTRVGEDEAIIIIHKDNYLQNEAGYILTRSLSELLEGFQLWVK